MGNLQEYLADTHPTNTASRLAILAAGIAGADITLTWIGGSNAQQFLECTPSLASNVWATILTNRPPTAITNVATHAGRTAGSNLFYRVTVR